MKKLLIILLAICLISCEFETKSFAEIGGILYTFQLPENTSQADVGKLEAIFKKRIASYVRQKPKLDYNKEKQQFSVGVPKSLTSKNPDLCKKLLMANGSVLMISGNQSYYEVSKSLEEINKIIKENPLEIDGKISKQYLFDILEPIPSQQMMPFLGVASLSDTALIMKMIQQERFQDKFAKEMIWVWKVDKQEMKAYLHVYSMNNMKVDETMIGNVEIDHQKSMDGNPALAINFDETGTAKFTKMTTEAAAVKGLIHIFVSQELVLSPMVQSKISGGSVEIRGDNVEEVIFMKSIIEAGRLPVSIELIGEEEK